MTGAESEITSNFYLVLSIILTTYFIMSLIGNMFLIGAAGKRKWLGLIPIVNDYFIYKNILVAKNICYIYTGYNHKSILVRLKRYNRCCNMFNIKHDSSRYRSYACRPYQQSV